MATKYEPVTVAKIDQGKFLTDGEAAFLNVQKEVIAHAAAHGSAGGEVTMKVKITADADGVFKLITNVAEKMPTKPPRVTAAFVEEQDDGTECLFSQSGGTRTGNPKQQRLCNDDGSEIKQLDEATA